MKTFFFSLLFILMLSVSSPLYAAEGISKQEAVNIANRRHPGRILAVKRKANVYQIKTLSKSGKVQIIQVDAINGNVLPASKSRR